MILLRPEHLESNHQGHDDRDKITNRASGFCGDARLVRSKVRSARLSGPVRKPVEVRVESGTSFPADLFSVHLAPVKVGLTRLDYFIFGNPRDKIASRSSKCISFSLCIYLTDYAIQ
jgi:hypothetical protein